MDRAHSFRGSMCEQGSILGKIIDYLELYLFGYNNGEKKQPDNQLPWRN
jgi:hypothetical protein